MTLDDAHLLFLQQLSIDLLNGLLCRLLGLEVNETVSLGLWLVELVLGLVDADLARQDVAEGGECVVELFVVDGFVQVLDENVSVA